MLVKLQRKTLIPIQILGYALGLFVGISIVLVSIQFYHDVKSILSSQTDVFNNNTLVISKNVSVFKTLGTSRMYFSERDIEEIARQDFVENVAVFSNSTFEINAYTSFGPGMPGFQTELFFESIPDNYLDVTTDDWHWTEGMDFIPIVIPEDYVNLYNFGYAESQGLPVFSQKALSEISFNIRISGNGKQQFFKSRIVAFSGKINSILVPENFLSYANREFGRQSVSNPNRLLVEMNRPADEKALIFFNDRNYNINKEKLEEGKLMYFFRTAFGFVFLIALIITALSVAFVILSFSLIFEKNKELINNLFNIGYSVKVISAFYQWVISIITLLAVSAAVFTGLKIQQFYSSQFVALTDMASEISYILPVGALIVLCLILIYNVFLPLKVRKTVKQG